MASQMMEALAELCQEKHIDQGALLHELEQSLAEAQAALEDYREDGGWLASEESIAGYRAVAEHILINYRDALYSAEAGILADAKQRYLDGDLPADQLIAELERRYVMREREEG